MVLKLLTVKQVAEILGMHPITIRRWVLGGTLPGIKLGKALRISEEDLDQFVRDRYLKTKKGLSVYEKGDDSQANDA